MKRVIWTIALVLVVGLMPATAGEQQDQLLAIKVVKANPAKMADYEKALKHAMALYGEHKLDVPAIWVSQDENWDYHLVIPIKNHADLDRLWDAFGKVRKAIGEEALAEMEAMFDGTVESSSMFLTKYLADLSYTPEGFQEKSKDWRYFEMLVWYVKPDHARDARKLAAAYKKLYIEKGIDDGWAIYSDLMGPDLPVMNIMSWAESPVHMQDKDKAHKEALGDAVKPLHEQFMTMTRKVETTRGWFRPELSYLPKSEEKKTD